MSTDPTEQTSGLDGSSVPPKDDGPADSTAHTPRAEQPIAVTVSTPSTVLNQLAQQSAESGENDYFTARPAETELLKQEQKAQVLSILTPSAPATASSETSDATAEGQMLRPALEESLTLPERPAPHTNASTWSVQSAESVATVTAANFTAAAALPASQRPAFPNQSYAALHHQQYPVPYAPPTSRQRGPQSHQIHTFSSALASIHKSGSRTVGNTPAATPGGGLFSPHSAFPASSSEWESAITPGTYASPFLHFTHRVPPKETHVADVDVDPISGRKLINHYEVIDELGRGTHGKVKLGRDLHANGAYVAIKIVERFSKRRRLGKLGTTGDKVKKEVAILKKARHPNIVALLEVIDDPTRKKVYIVLEWVERGEIQWRAKAPREIAMLEARRYERERHDPDGEQSAAEDLAILVEARKRLDKHRRRTLRKIRHVRRQAEDGQQAWSNEMVGDDESDVSEDDVLSRISTATGDSWGSRLAFDDARRGSRASTVLRNAEEQQHENQNTFLSLSAEPRSSSPMTYKYDAQDFGNDSLEGTMYGAYAHSSSEPSRVPSIEASLHSAASGHPQKKGSANSLRQMAAEALDGDLNDELLYVPVMTQQQCRVAFRDTLLGLQYLHYQGIVHRDIKPPNLLATIDHRVKISDFGVSYLGRPLRDGEPGEDVSEHEAQDLHDEAKELAKTVGTPAFYAPELCIQGDESEVLPITKAIDVWALGITLFCMLFARTPYVDSEYVMMRLIAEEEIYIPRKRLRPVEGNSKSRPSSRGRQNTPFPSERRHEYDVTYEAIDDDLYDLLRGLLTKDPRKRVTLEEVRKHPWVHADIIDKDTWFEQIDPSGETEGKKIEVSREDVNAAVVPLLDRVRSGIKKVGERLGFGGGKSPSGRTRTHSNASLANGGSPVPSAGSSSSNISAEGRRSSLRGEEFSLSSKVTRDGEHPLSQSVAASPRLELLENPMIAHLARPDSAHATAERTGDHATPPRPTPPERAYTTMATAGSMRTVRQTDFRRGRADESPPPSPGLPGTPTTVDLPGSLGGMWGGSMARRILKSVRERSAARSSETRTPSSERSPVGSIDTHGEPTLAMSQMTAIGRLNQPAAFEDLAPTSNPGSAYNSPAISRTHSLVGSVSGDRLNPSMTDTGVMSRTSSGGSITSVGKRHPANSTRLHQLPNPLVSSRPPSSRVPESSEAEWDRAEREYIRKRIQEQEPEVRSPSSFDDRDCPPSPDDRHPDDREPRSMSTLDISTHHSSHETSPTGAQLPSAMLSSCSDFGSAASASISNPSIPSAVSASSSTDYANVAGHGDHPDPIKRTTSSEDTLDPRAVAPEETEDVGYTADDAEDVIASDNDYDSDSSTDSDGGLVMTRRRSAARPSGSVTSSPATAFDGSSWKSRRDTGVSKKSSRSGSNHTMQKVRTRNSDDEQRQAESLPSGGD